MRPLGQHRDSSNECSNDSPKTQLSPKSPFTVSPSMQRQSGRISRMHILALVCIIMMGLISRSLHRAGQVVSGYTSLEMQYLLETLNLKAARRSQNSTVMGFEMVDGRDTPVSVGGVDQVESNGATNLRSQQTHDASETESMRNKTLEAQWETSNTTLQSIRKRQSVKHSLQSSLLSNKQIKNNRLNVVLLYADDWTYRTLSLVNPIVKTPHLASMAKRGMFFSRNCVTSSICWQSRANMFTGTTTSVHEARKISDDAFLTNRSRVSWEQTLYPLMKHAGGYHRGYIGKWHNAMPSANQTSIADWHRLYFRSHWEQRKGQLRHVTELNGADAVEYLREVRPPDKPFFLTVAFYATHAQEARPHEQQYEHQNHTKHFYENITIPTPKTATAQAWNDMPYFFQETNEGRKRWAKRYKTPDMFQHSMKTMYRMATEVDEEVGRIINELRSQGVYENTMIIFTSDNGVFHGEHGLADKWYPHEESIRVPLIIIDPRMPAHMHGQVNDDLTLSIDLAPTILDAAGLQAPAFMQGRNIAELYMDDLSGKAKKPWRKEFFYEWNQGHPHNASGHGKPMFLPAVFALIQRDYKYFYWPQVNYEQVFDLRSDPFEENDLLNVTSQTDASKLEALRLRYAELKHWTQSGFPV